MFTQRAAARLQLARPSQPPDARAPGWSTPGPPHTDCKQELRHHVDEEENTVLPRFAAKVRYISLYVPADP